MDTSADAAQVARLRNPWQLPGAIIAAGIILALATYTVRTHHLIGVPAGSLDEMRPVTPLDHLAGNPSAPVVLVEYSDIDSEYGKQLHAVMEQLMTEYAAAGKVAWVYRHFPLIDQHQHAASHAEAAECVTSLEGPESFWRFIDSVNVAAPANSQFDPRDYPAVVSALGVDQASFEQCMTEHTFQQRVGADFNNAMAIGATGAPYSVLLAKGQPPVTIGGSVPYATMKQAIDDAVAKAAAAQ